MKDARPALRYAKAILNLAKETSAETEVNADMQLIAATISGEATNACVFGFPSARFAKFLLKE